MPFLWEGSLGRAKTALQSTIARNIRFDFSQVTKINGDEFRAYHPQFEQLNNENDVMAAYYTDVDTGIWVAKAINLAKTTRSSMLIEGTLRNPQVTINSASDLYSAGYRNELHVVVANQFFSRLRIFSRYLGQRAIDGYGRYTLLEAHDASYKHLPDSLSAIISSSLFSRVVLYDVEHNVLFDSDFDGPDVMGAVGAIVSFIRSTLHQAVDRLLADAQAMRQLALELNCSEVVLSDITKLVEDIIASVK